MHASKMKSIMAACAASGQVIRFEGDAVVVYPPGIMPEQSKAGGQRKTLQEIAEGGLTGEELDALDGA